MSTPLACGASCSASWSMFTTNCCTLEFASSPTLRRVTPITLLHSGLCTSRCKMYPPTLPVAPSNIAAYSTLASPLPPSWDIRKLTVSTRGDRSGVGGVTAGGFVRGAAEALAGDISHGNVRSACYRYGSLPLKRFLSTLSERIFDSSVDRGTPSLAAAPGGPDTRPLLAASAASTP